MQAATARQTAQRLCAAQRYAVVQRDAVLRVVRDEDAADLGHESARERAAASMPLLEPSFDV